MSYSGRVLTDSESTLHNLSSIEGKAWSHMETSESRPEYPEFHFDIPSEKMVSRELGGRTIEVSDEERIRVVMRALFDAGATEYSSGATFDFPQERLQRAQNKLAQTTLITVATRFGNEKVSKRKKELVDFQKANDAVMTELEKTRDPIWQVLTYVKNKFGDMLPNEKIRELCTNILSVTHWKKLNAQYIAQIAVEKEKIHTEPL